MRYLAPYVSAASATTRTASTAFCLLYKLFTLHVTVRQMTRMLAHSNPFTRALGALYLRFSIPPDQLLVWLKPLIVPSPGDSDPSVVVLFRDPPMFVPRPIVPQC